MRIYLAGPEVFLPDAAATGGRKRAICARHGLVGLFPLADPGAPGQPTSAAIYRDCLDLLRGCDAIVANLTPFRGLAADPGTVFELGLAVGWGKPAFGYTNDPRDLRSRVRDTIGLEAGEGAARARDGLAVEDFGLFENLMIGEALREGGGVVVAHEAPADPLRDLSTFETCLRQVARHRATAPARA